MVMSSISWAEWHDLGNQACLAGKKDLGMKLYDVAVSVASDEAERVGTLAAIACEKLLNREDVSWCVKALEDKSALASATHNDFINLSTAYLRLPDPEKALGSARIASMLDPVNAGVCGNVALAYGMLGDYVQEEKWSRRSARLDSNLRYQHAMVRMKLIDQPTDEDWLDFSFDYDSRKKPMADHLIHRLNIYKPGPVIVCQEQGIGDFLMIARAFKWLKDFGCQPTLYTKDLEVAELANTGFGIQVKTDATLAGSYKYCIHSMDLLQYRNQWVNYSTLDVAWNEVIRKDEKSGIGVNFTGNPGFEFEYTRGCYDNWFKYEVKGFVGQEELRDLSVRSPSLLALSERISNLKAVVTTDTMIAHMAGILDIPCLVMLAPNKDWRWFQRWYGPTFQTVTQSAVGDWASILPDVQKFVKENRD